MASPVIPGRDPHIINVGSNPDFPPVAKGSVIDCKDKEPIALIESKVLEETGIAKFTDVQGFKIKGEDLLNDNGSIKILPYRDKDGIDFITFERLYTVSFNDKDGMPHTLTFKQKVFTSVKIPTKEVPLSWRARRKGVPGKQIDMTAYENAVRMAGMAANVYTGTVENGVRFKNDNTKGKFGENATEKVAALQKQGYISITAKVDGEAVINPMSPRELDSAKHRQFEHIRSGINSLEIIFDKKNLAISQKIDQKNFFKIFKEKFAVQDKYQIDPNDCEGEMRYFAASLNVVQTQDRHASRLDETLEAQGIVSEDYLRHLEAHLIVLQGHFEEDLSFFHDPDKLDHLLDKFGEQGAPHLSDAFKEKLLEYMPKRRVPFKTSLPPLFVAIHEMANDDITPKEKSELSRIANALQKAKDHAGKIDEQMKINENDLKSLHVSNKRELKRIVDIQDKRKDLLSRDRLPKISKELRTYQGVEEIEQPQEEELSESDSDTAEPAVAPPPNPFDPALAPPPNPFDPPPPN